jgi:hypothetical protein
MMSHISARKAGQLKRRYNRTWAKYDQLCALKATQELTDAEQDEANKAFREILSLLGSWM